MPDGHVFNHDPQRCIKCFTCEIACKQWRGIDPGTVKLRRVYEVTTGTFPAVTRTFHSEACHHCSEAPCVEACPTGAITTRADGIVRVDAAMCDGCRACLPACPFGVPQFGRDGVLQLCDQCSDRLADGKRPICVDSCPTQALRWNRPTSG
jgi:anaerobic dimethyl sulfoxide reductase subunit B